MFNSDFSQSFEAGLPPETIVGRLLDPVVRGVPADGIFPSELVYNSTWVTFHACVLIFCILPKASFLVFGVCLPKTEVSRQRKTTGACNKKKRTHCSFFFTGKSLNDSSLRRVHG